MTNCFIKPTENNITETQERQECSDYMPVADSEQFGSSKAVSVQEQAGKWTVVVAEKWGPSRVHTFDNMDFAFGYARAQLVRLWLEELDDSGPSLAPLDINH